METTDPHLRALTRAEFEDHREDVGRRFEELPKKHPTWVFFGGIALTVVLSVSGLVSRAEGRAETIANGAKVEAKAGIEELRAEVRELRAEMARQQRRTEEKVDKVLERLERGRRQ